MTVLAQHAVYGPVPSRRLGRSLGVDLVPLKTCTYDCIYCQLGRTSHKTVRRGRWVEPKEVVAQVRDRLGSRPDVIALAGSGEPTLHAGIGEVIAGIKSLTDVPLAVITNGSLLSRRSVRQSLAPADIVLPSLDATDAASYEAVNRPHPNLRFRELVDGMASFRGRFAGQIWLEVMLLDGPTSTDEQVERLAAWATRIRPDRIQLNTVVRPPAESSARPVSADRLVAVAAAFTPRAEVIAGAPSLQPDLEATTADVLSVVSRRPCTAADVATGLGIHVNAALKALTVLVERGDVVRRMHAGGSFYAAGRTYLDREES
jgi:wyosine [tRNA(Phe)-imidazoG37] synthetase (radical SAM superfamily)